MYFRMSLKCSVYLKKVNKRFCTYAEWACSKMKVYSSCARMYVAVESYNNILR